MARLTKEDIIRSRDSLKALVAMQNAEPKTYEIAWNGIDQLCDLALQSLSQEAVREEVLADAIKMCETIAATGGGATHCIEYLRALKREPNAAARDRSTERASGERTSAGTSPSPAPAAPDVASMVKRLRGCVNDRHDPAVTTCEDIEPLALEAAALLARLGQGWIPPETVIEIDEDGNVHPEGVNLKNLRPGASDD